MAAILSGVRRKEVRMVGTRIRDFHMDVDVVIASCRSRHAGVKIGGLL
jgi:hypothetical protein